MERGLFSSGEHPRVVLLSDSKAALQAVWKAGKTGKARTRRLGALMTEIKRRTDLHAVRFAWVKAHIGIMGNGGADKGQRRHNQGYTRRDYGGWIETGSEGIEKDKPDRGRDAMRIWLGSAFSHHLRQPPILEISHR